MPGAQGGLSVICRTAPAQHTDHDTDHDTGAARALPCFDCNGALGQFKDDPFLLHVAAFHVGHHRERQALDRLRKTTGVGPEGASRPGSPPVGSQRRPGTQRTSARSQGRSSGSRRRQQAGEADG
jgi:hypothetical protein